MDKNEYTLKVEEIKNLISQRQYAQAAEIADTIDWRKPRSARTLCIVSDLYKINRRYEDARDMLLLAYERRPGSRTICYSLCELSIKMEEYVQAIEYYKEFVQVAPKDPGRYILQYKLYEAQDVSLEERIAVLEELKKKDYREKWAYELAYLYHRVGLATRCVEECDELILWFGDGKYVIKAMELKMLHQPLTPEQQEKYDHRFDPTPEYDYEQGSNSQDSSYDGSQGYAQDGSYDGNQGYVQDGSYDGSQGYVQDGSYDGSQGYVQDGSYDGNQDYAQDSGYDGTQGYVQDGSYEETQGYAQDGSYEETQGYAQDDNYDQVTDDTKVYAPVHPDQPAQTPVQPAEDDFDIHVKTMDVGQYNTINLQAELAAGLREVLGEDHEKEKETSDPITRAIVAPMMEANTETINYPEIPEEDEEPKPQTEQMEGTEVFFGETGEIGDLPQVPGVETEEILPEETPVRKQPDVVPEMSEVQEATVQEPEVQNPNTQEMQELQEPKTQEAQNLKIQKAPETASEQENAQDLKPTEELHEITATPVPVAPVEPPKELANVLAQESDGQISLVMPEAERIEKQITGQMNIDDILAEWERKKKENLEKREEEVRQHVLQQTGAMFTEFEQAVRDGLLEKLEKEKSVNADEATEVEETPAEEPVTDVITDADEVEELEDVAETVEEEGASAAETDDVVEELAEEPVYDPESETVEDAETSDEPVEELSEELPEEEPSEEPEDAVTEEIFTEEPSEEPADAEPQGRPQKPERATVERDKAKVRALTREERELYAPFIQSKSAREQLVNAIDNISLAAYTGNVIITGEEGMDTLSLAKNMIREIQATDSNFSGKVAKISGHALNKKDTAETLARLKNGALIICKASEMNDTTVNAMHKALQQESQGIVIILEDTKREIDKFLEKHQKLRECFTARMDVEALSNDTLVAFGRQYAREKEYSIDELGVLALHTRIEDMQTIDHVVTVVDVKEIVDEAIHHANRKTLKHFFDVLFAKRYDDEDMIILTEKDFA